MLFTLYINDLPTVIKDSLVADNAELHCSHPSLSVVEHLLQSNLSAVGVFFISLNASDINFTVYQHCWYTVKLECNTIN